MFGYVRIFKPELKVAEYEHYQGVYCSLCRDLGKRYGFLARMTLSYDLTFLALFRMALDDSCAGFGTCRCPVHPLRRRVCCGENEHISFSADAAALLVYYKLRDNLSDSGFWKSLPQRLLLPFAARFQRKARKRRPELEQLIRTGMENQARMEAAHTASIDAAAEPFAQMMAGLAECSGTAEDERRILNRFGYCLGRWIYLLDAADDLEEDLKQGSYNPYVIARGLHADDPAALQETRAYSLLTLNACLAECAAACNLLSVRRFGGIIHNILEQGMPAVQKQVITQKGNHHERKRSL